MSQEDEKRQKNEWDDMAHYLAESWILRHNDDYLAFLVERQLRPMPFASCVGTFTFKHSGSNGNRRPPPPQKSAKHTKGA